MNPILINVNGAKTVGLDVRVFNGGEVNVCVPDRKYPVSPSIVSIKVTLESSEDVMALMMAVDAVRRRFPTVEQLLLEMAYAPYARQDRVCNKGEALTSKVFADMINSCNFHIVEICDPHSDVLPALINNCHIITLDDLICGSGLAERILRDEFIIVAPDAGSVKKVEKLSSKLGGRKIVYGTKHRDLKTGALSGFGYTANVDINGKDLLIVDDICDGGGTFIGLAEKLKEGGAKSVSLYVTHGIFSRGVEYLIENGIDHIWTTDSLYQKSHDKLTTFTI